MFKGKKTFPQMLIIIAAVIVVFVGVKILKSVSEATDTYDRVPMVMAVDGKLCLDTGYKSALANRPDSVVYTINSAVDRSETPVESNQSNFGIGYRYQFVSDETIEVEIDGSWWVYVTESKRRESDFWESLRQNNSSPLSSAESDPAAAVQSALEILTQEAYTRSVRVDEITIDEDETYRMIEMYKGSSLAESRGWTDEYLTESFIAVRAKYCAEYDHEKTFLEDGNIDQYFYLTKDPETDLWIIVDASTNSQPNSYP